MGNPPGGAPGWLRGRYEPWSSPDVPTPPAPGPWTAQKVTPGGGTPMSALSMITGPSPDTGTDPPVGCGVSGEHDGRVFPRTVDVSSTGNTFQADPTVRHFLSALQCQHTGLVGQEIVVAVGVGGASLVEELHVAGIDGHGLVGVGTDQLTVTDVIGPGGATVGLPREGVALGGGLRCPRA